MKLIEDLGQIEVGTKGHKKRYGIYECPICNIHFKTMTSDVKCGKSTKCKSCNTVVVKTTHGLSKTKLYSIISAMIQRTSNQKSKDYKDYGERGIVVCDEWKLNKDKFIKWSIDNGYSEGLSIDRINVNGNYEPSNCRWADAVTQANNKRAHHES
jgi:hypothetical protein